MNRTTTTADLHPCELLLLALLITAHALIELAAALAALHRPRRPALPPAPPEPPAALPPSPPPPAAALAALPVRELRRIARAAGHRALARSGRRTDLLAALGAA